MKLGCHVGMKSPGYLTGAVKEGISYNADAIMIYTGAPQNSRRADIEKMKIEEGIELANQNSIKDIIVHAPYIINLASPEDDKWNFAKEFLTKEIIRAERIGASNIILHPGNHVGTGTEVGIDRIAMALNELISDDINVNITLETMSGKGTEVGKTFEEIAEIIAKVKFSDKIRVCLDTCHIHDAGYDLTKIDDVLDEFDKLIGLEKLTVVHFNDSKNEIGASKDRHENLGHGKIGFETMMSIANNERLKNVPLILETPHIEKRPPYKEEIEMIKTGNFINIK